VNSIAYSDQREEVLSVINAFTAFAEIYIDDIWVDSTHQRKGYGTRLLSSLENHLRIMVA
jgi:ribosomal protein S18 acetylase RimI-like enzyme